MNLRSRATPVHPGIQLAPLVDVLLLLLIFFLLTFNAARNENELDVKVPKASAAKEKENALLIRENELILSTSALSHR